MSQKLRNSLLGLQNAIQAELASLASPEYFIEVRIDLKISPKVPVSETIKTGVSALDMKYTWGKCEQPIARKGLVPIELIEKVLDIPTLPRSMRWITVALRDNNNHAIGKERHKHYVNAKAFRLVLKKSGIPLTYTEIDSDDPEYIPNDFQVRFSLIEPPKSVRNQS